MEYGGPGTNLSSKCKIFQNSAEWQRHEGFTNPLYWLTVVLRMKTGAKFWLIPLATMAVAITGWLIFVSSVNSYHARHRLTHLEKLQRIQASNPSEKQLYNILGQPLQVLAPGEALDFARKTWGGQTVTVDPETLRHSKHTAIFLAEDMVYLIFTDANGRMIDFALLRN